MNKTQKRIYYILRRELTYITDNDEVNDLFADFGRSVIREILHFNIDKIAELIKLVK